MDLVMEVDTWSPKMGNTNQSRTINMYVKAKAALLLNSGLKQI